MPGQAILDIFRYNPESEFSSYSERYYVPVEGTTSVLQALIYIYEHLDSTIAFRYGCRYPRCGLCGMEIDEKPSLACVSLIKEGQCVTVKPLPKFPVIKDLVVDRSFIHGLFERHTLYIPQQDTWREKIIVEPEFNDLLGCMDCLRCLAACPNWSASAQDVFAGPFLFVKLAQLCLDPRDNLDRREQAKALGLEKCAECRYDCSRLTGCGLSKKAVDILSFA